MEYIDINHKMEEHKRYIAGIGDDALGLSFKCQVDLREISKADNNPKLWTEESEEGLYWTIKEMTKRRLLT